MAHLFVEVVAELAQPELTFAAGRFQLLPLGGLRQAVAGAQQLGRAAEEAAVGEDLAQGGVGFDEAPVLRVVAGTQVALLELFLGEQQLAAQGGLFEQQQRGAGAQVGAREPARALARRQVQPVFHRMLR